MDTTIYVVTNIEIARGNTLTLAIYHEGSGRAFIFAVY
jgi:hypothetical protein